MKLVFGQEKGISGVCSLVIPWIMNSGALQEEERLPCYIHHPDSIYSALAPLTINELTVLLLKTSSSTCSLEHITSYLVKGVNPADYSLSNPNSSTATFIQAKPLTISQSDNCTSLLTVLFAPPLSFLSSSVHSQHSSQTM